ncbi:HAD-IIB family hydrolase [Candidatus Daviesbacteria bacterium]|nr:HAD-IIB family hydrolase [Candidatus Daviesbacteria bacterium]
MSSFSPNFLKEYKLVVSDFDGTLVDKSLELSSESEKFVKYILENNLHFSIASGRPFFGIIEKACYRLGLNDYQIVAGGSIIISPKSKKPVWIKHFEPKLAKELISKLLDLKANFAVETSQSVYTENSQEKPQYGAGIIFKNIDDLNYEEVNKIVIFPLDISKDIMNKIHVLVESYKDKFHSVNANSPVGPAYDLTPASTSKHFAVLELIKILNINRQETIGIGDSYNDYPLLTACRYKVVIKGAPKELVEIADLVISREELFNLAQ